MKKSNEFSFLPSRLIFQQVELPSGAEEKVGKKKSPEKPEKKEEAVKKPGEAEKAKVAETVKKGAKIERKDLASSIASVNQAMKQAMKYEREATKNIVSDADLKKALGIRRKYEQDRDEAKGALGVIDEKINKLKEEKFPFEKLGRKPQLDEMLVEKRNLEQKLQIAESRIAKIDTEIAKYKEHQRPLSEKDFVRYNMVMEKDAQIFSDKKAEKASGVIFANEPLKVIETKDGVALVEYAHFNDEKGKTTFRTGYMKAENLPKATAAITPENVKQIKESTAKIIKEDIGKYTDLLKKDIAAVEGKAQLDARKDKTQRIDTPEVKAYQDLQEKFFNEVRESSRIGRMFYGKSEGTLWNEVVQGAGKAETVKKPAEKTPLTPEEKRIKNKIKKIKKRMKMFHSMMDESVEDSKRAENAAQYLEDKEAVDQAKKRLDQLSNQQIQLEKDLKVQGYRKNANKYIQKNADGSLIVNFKNAKGKIDKEAGNAIRLIDMFPTAHRLEVTTKDGKKFLATKNEAGNDFVYYDEKKLEATNKHAPVYDGDTVGIKLP